MDIFTHPLGDRFFYSQWHTDSSNKHDELINLPAWSPNTTASPKSLYAMFYQWQTPQINVRLVLKCNLYRTHLFPFFVCVKGTKPRRNILQGSKSRCFPDQSKQVEVWKHPQRGKVKAIQLKKETPKHFYFRLQGTFINPRVFCVIVPLYFPQLLPLFLLNREIVHAKNLSSIISHIVALIWFSLAQILWDSNPSLLHGLSVISIFYLCPIRVKSNFFIGTVKCPSLKSQSPESGSWTNHVLTRSLSATKMFSPFL